MFPLWTKVHMYLQWLFVCGCTGYCSASTSFLPSTLTLLSPSYPVALSPCYVYPTVTEQLHQQLMQSRSELARRQRQAMEVSHTPRRMYVHTCYTHTSSFCHRHIPEWSYKLAQKLSYLQLISSCQSVTVPMRTELSNEAYLTPKCIMNDVLTLETTIVR